MIHFLVMAVMTASLSQTSPGKLDFVKSSALTDDLMLSLSDDSDDLGLVWWIPDEFWSVAFKDDSDISDENIADLLELVENYTLFVIVSGRLNSIGLVKWKTEEDIARTLSIRDNRGHRYTPVTLSPTTDRDMVEILDSIKPGLVSLLGAMGENMHFVVFPRQNRQGKRLLDPLGEGSFTVSLGMHAVRYRLPLGSLLKPKNCLLCHEEMSGAFSFCPWDGNRLGR